jgi:hypothetical protein
VPLGVGVAVIAVVGCVGGVVAVAVVAAAVPFGVVVFVLEPLAIGLVTEALGAVV